MQFSKTNASSSPIRLRAGRVSPLGAGGSAGNNNNKRNPPQ